MNLALNEAEKGIGLTGSNPSVGCLLLNQQKEIIGLARTANNGRPHAEAVAIEQAQLQGYSTDFAIAYVTLEPCVHQGASQSCVASIIDAGIKTVVVATVDPDLRTNGLGIKTLRDSGVEVIYDRSQTNEKIRAEKIIRGFISRMSKKRPFISLKIASSLDGKIALHNGQSKWITTEKQREYSHSIRERADAILTGIGTVLADDPMLNCRLPGSDKRPIRIILDGELKIPEKSMICKTAFEIRTIIYTSITSEQDKKELLEKLGIEVVIVPNFIQQSHASSSNLDLERVLHHSAKLGINEILLETGSKLTTRFLQERLVDQLYWFYSNKIIGNDGLPVCLDLGCDDLDMYSNIPTEIILDRELYSIKIM